MALKSCKMTPRWWTHWEVSSLLMTTWWGYITVRTFQNEQYVTKLHNGTRYETFITYRCSIIKRYVVHFNFAELCGFWVCFCWLTTSENLRKSVGVTDRYSYSTENVSEKGTLQNGTSKLKKTVIPMHNVSKKLCAQECYKMVCKRWTRYSVTKQYVTGNGN